MGWAIPKALRCKALAVNAEHCVGCGDKSTLFYCVELNFWGGSAGAGGNSGKTVVWQRFVVI